MMDKVQAPKPFWNHSINISDLKFGYLKDKQNKIRSSTFYLLVYAPLHMLEVFIFQLTLEIQQKL